jgi:carboxyl-terminal processing protease
VQNVAKIDSLRADKKTNDAMISLRFVPLLLLLGAAALTASQEAAPSGPRPAAPAIARNSDPIRTEQKEAVLARIGTIVTERAFVGGADLSKWPQILAKRREAIDKAATHGQFANQVNLALSDFGFSHLQLFTPEAANARITRSQVGYGFRLEFVAEGARVVDVVKDSPAMEAGIEIGDLIVEADGKLPKSVADLRPEEGETAAFKIRRTDGAIRELRLTRRAFSTVIPESIAWPRENVAMIRIPTFDVGYDRQNVDRLFDEAQKAELLILDLRANGGGAVLNLLHLAGRLLPPGTDMGAFLSRATVTRYARETGKDANDLAAVASWTEAKLRPSTTRRPRFEGRVVVLTNGGTGSASEIMSATLREQMNAPLIGTKTYGGVLASVIVSVGEGYQLLHPITEYITPKGMRLEGNGLIPDVEASPSRRGEPDSGVEAALKWWDAQPKRS